MKKILITLMLLGTICANTFAQEYDIVEAGEEVDFNNSEVYLTVGTPSLVGVLVGLGGAIAKALGEGIAQSLGQEGDSQKSDSSKSKTAAFAITGGYNYFFTENFGVGAFASYEKFDFINLITVQAKVTAQYGWEHFKIYHALSGGVLMAPGADKPSFKADLTYLGLKLDFDNWNVFLDASVPSTAIVKAGAAFKF